MNTNFCMVALLSIAYPYSVHPRYSRPSPQALTQHPRAHPAFIATADPGLRARVQIPRSPRDVRATILHCHDLAARMAELDTRPARQTQVRDPERVVRPARRSTGVFIPASNLWPFDERGRSRMPMVYSSPRYITGTASVLVAALVALCGTLVTYGGALVRLQGLLGCCGRGWH